MLRRVLLPMLAVLMLYTGASVIASPVATGASARITTAEYESRLLSRLNARRVSVGCARLRANKYLIRAARAHSARMASRATLSHQLPGEARFGTRIRRAGYTNTRLVAENVGYAWSDPMPLHSAWVNSGPHRANMDNCRLRDVGIGVAYGDGRAWATVDFGRRAS